MGHFASQAPSSKPADTSSIASSPFACSCLTEYKYTNRRVPYRSEQLEITESELSVIKALPIGPVSPANSPTAPGPCKVIIDTDIGTDLDDSLALLYALRLPGLEIVGVTTNYAVSEIRALVAERIITLHRSFRPDCPSIPVVVGSSRPLGSHRDYFVTGTEGVPFVSDEIRERKGIDEMNRIEQMEAADFIAASVNGAAGQITICSIGIPTNIALAFKRHPEIASKIKEIIVMGCGSIVHAGESKSPFFEKPLKGEELGFVKSGKVIHFHPNHNLSGDSEASRILFNEMDTRIRIVPHDVTSQFWLEGKAIDHLRENSNEDSPSGAVGKLMLVWFGHRFGQNGQCPHDPLVIHEARYLGEEGCLQYVRGRMVLHEWASFSTFVPHENGPHLLAIAVSRHDDFLANLETVLTEKD
jgi:purine nucleosidase